MNKDLTFFPVSYYWSTGSLKDTIKVGPKTTTRYSLFYSNAACKNKVIDSKKLLVDLAKVTNPSAGEDVTICIKDSIQLQASGGMFYLWNDSLSLDTINISKPYAKPSITTTYIVTVSNQFCKGTDSVKVIVDLCLENLTDPVPQIITPNQDGKNDTWVINNIDYFTNNSVEIFNRWGNRVFYETPYNNSWDGKSDRGVDLPDGTYFYVINLGNGSKPQTGYIIIHR
jgi:gliding motility-associated-like protein